MMLRNRSRNEQNVAKAEGAVKRQALSKATVDAGGDKITGEPKPKRQALQDLSKVLSNVQIDSTKKPKINVEPKKPVTQRAKPKAKAEDLYPEIDFDKENAKDMAAVSDYASDIFRYYKYREAFFKVDNYVTRQTFVTTRRRAVTVDWMIECQESFELNHETLYLGVKLLDLFLNRAKLTSDSLQLWACAALFIASKYDERCPPLVDDFVYLAENKFTHDDLLTSEREMLKQIGFDLGAPISYRFLRRYSRVSKTDMPTLTLARYILETSLMYLSFCRVSESMLGAASLLLAFRMKNVGGWSKALHKYSGYTEKQLEPLVQSLNHMIIKSKSDTLATVRTKYTHEVFHEVAKTPSLPDAFAESDPVQA
jgi:hypothetical protein